MKCGILYKTEITSKNKSEFLHSNIKKTLYFMKTSALSDALII